MTPASPVHKISIKSISFWALKILLAVAFLGAGVAKLIGLAPMVAEFDAIGFGQWFRYFTAGCEIVGAILLLVPNTSPAGALLLGIVCVGALLAQVFALHQDVIHPIVLASILLTIAWTSRSDFMLLPGGKRRGRI